MLESCSTIVGINSKIVKFNSKIVEFNIKIVEFNSKTSNLIAKSLNLIVKSPNLIAKSSNLGLIVVGKLYLSPLGRRKEAHVTSFQVVVLHINSEARRQVALLHHEMIFVPRNFLFVPLAGTV